MENNFVLSMYPHLFVSAQRDGGTPPEKSASPPPFAPANAPPEGEKLLPREGFFLISTAVVQADSRFSIYQGGTTFCAPRPTPKPPRRGSRFRFAMTARRCDLSCENLCGAAGAAVRSSAPVPFRSHRGKLIQHGVAWRLPLMSVACEAPPVAEEASRVRRRGQKF